MSSADTNMKTMTSFWFSCLWVTCTFWKGCLTVPKRAHPRGMVKKCKTFLSTVLCLPWSGHHPYHKNLAPSQISMLSYDLYSAPPVPWYQCGAVEARVHWSRLDVQSAVIRFYRVLMVEMKLTAHFSMLAISCFYLCCWLTLRESFIHLLSCACCLM